MPLIHVRIGTAHDGIACCRIGDDPPIRCMSPSDLWRLLAAIQGDVLHLLPEGTEPTDESRAAAEAIFSGGRSAVLGSVLRADGTEEPAPSRSDAVRSARVPAGSLIVSAELAADLASRLEGRRWDRFWACDLAAIVGELCEPLRITGIIARRSAGDRDEGLRTDLLSPRRAGFRPYDPNVPTVVVVGPCDASCMLYFDAFSRSEGVNLRFLRPSHPVADMGWLCAASAVILVRGLAQALQSGVVDLMRAIGVPVYWFLDDDFFALASEYPSFAPYQPSQMNNLPERLAGIIVATQPLRESLSRTIGFPAERMSVLGPRLSRYWPRPTYPAVGIGLIGGTFRGEGLRTQVMPALANLGDPPRIVASDNLRPFLAGTDAEWEPFEPDFLTFLHRWQRRAPAVIVHPPARTGNLAGKSAATVLVAHAIGAVPVVADEPCFSDWTETHGVVKVSGQNWADALRHVLSPGVAAEMRGRLANVLSSDTRYSDDAQVLLSTVGHPMPVSEDMFHDRLNAALGSPMLVAAGVPVRVRRRLGQRLRESAAKRLRWLGFR